MAETNFLEEQKKQDDGKKENPYEALSRNVSSIGARLKVLEERYTNIRKKTQMTDQNLLDFEKDINGELRSLNEDLLDIKRDTSEVNSNLVLMSSELNDSVKISDFKVVEKYVDMWQPMNFVTRNEFNKVMREKFK